MEQFVTHLIEEHLSAQLFGRMEVFVHFRALVMISPEGSVDKTNEFNDQPIASILSIDQQNGSYAPVFR